MESRYNAVRSTVVEENFKEASANNWTINDYNELSLCSVQLVSDPNRFLRDLGVKLLEGHIYPHIENDVYYAALLIEADQNTNNRPLIEYLSGFTHKEEIPISVQPSNLIAGLSSRKFHRIDTEEIEDLGHQVENLVTSNTYEGLETYISLYCFMLMGMTYRQVDNFEKSIQDSTRFPERYERFFGKKTPVHSIFNTEVCKYLKNKVSSGSKLLSSFTKICLEYQRVKEPDQRLIGMINYAFLQKADLAGMGMVDMVLKVSKVYSKPFQEVIYQVLSIENLGNFEELFKMMNSFGSHKAWRFAISLTTKNITMARPTNNAIAFMILLNVLPTTEADPLKQKYAFKALKLTDYQMNSAVASASYLKSEWTKSIIETAPVDSIIGRHKLDIMRQVETNLNEDDQDLD